MVCCLKFTSHPTVLVFLSFSLGRIDRKIEFPLPDEKTRRRIFQIHTKRMTLADDLDLEEYITAKDDLSGADIKVHTVVSIADYWYTVSHFRQSVLRLVSWLSEKGE